MRLFSVASAGARERSASDLALAIFTLAPTLLLGLIAIPESGFERSVAALFAAVPNALDVLWRLGLAGLGLWALTMLVAAVLQRRWGALVEIGLSAVLALALGMLTWRRLNGGWPNVDQLITGGLGQGVPLTLLAVATALSSAVGPHLTKPVRATGRAAVGIGVASAVILGVTTPAGALLSVLLGVGAGALVHLGLGTSAGRPTVEQTETALSALGMAIANLTTSPRQSSGVVTMNGVDAAREPVRVKVYGRDARDAQLLSTIWRRTWYSNDSSSSGSRERQVEHEAFVTLLAAASGVEVPGVAVAGMTSEGDALIAVRGAGQPLSELAESQRVDIAPRLWGLVRRLHEARLVHGELSLDSFGVDDSPADRGTVLRELAPATLSISDVERTTDWAQLTCITATLLGIDATVALASDELGSAGVEAMLAYLQLPALGRDLRRAVKASDVDLDSLRAALAAEVEVEPPDTAKLRRVSPQSLGSVALAALVAFGLFSAFGNLDMEELADLIAGISPGWAIAALCVAQAVFVFRAISVKGASPKELPLGPLTILQTAVAFIALAVPSTAGRLAMNIRFFQRQGMTAPTAMSVAAIDGFSGFLVQISLLFLTVVVGIGQVDLHLDVASASSRLGWIPAALGIFAAVVVVGVVIAVCVPRLRTRIGDRVGPIVADARSTLASLRSPAKLIRLFGGNFATELIMAATLGLSLQAFGASANLATLLVISVGAALFGGLMPVPGGIGVMEAALATGLVAAGIEASTATATALLFRATTYYLPPIWGWVAMRWLQRNSFL